MKAIHWRSLRVITTGFAFAGLGVLGCGKDSNGPNAVDPTADFTSACAVLDCEFTDASDDDGPISSWFWEFGDGQTATTQHPAHSFLASSSYTVKLTVTDGDAITATMSKNVAVTGPGNLAPNAAFGLVCAALRCDFNDNSTDPDGTVDGRSWDFGDGNTSTEVNPAHTYASGGTRTVTLTVTDNSGATKSASKQAVTSDPVVASLSCVDGSAPGGFVACKLKLTEAAGYKVTLVGSSCDAHGNLFRIVEPVVDTLTVDGCYEPAGTEIVRAGPYPANTEISAEIVAPLLVGPPRLRVSGSYPEWTLEFEDGADTDFNDLIMTVTALP